MKKKLFIVHFFTCRITSPIIFEVKLSFPRKQLKEAFHFGFSTTSTTFVLFLFFFLVPMFLFVTDATDDV